MLKRLSGMAVCMSLLLAVGLSGCSSPEEKAQADYQQAVTIEKAGDLDQALSLYETLAKKYPETKAGRLASKARVRIVALKQTRQHLVMEKHAERLRMVLSGYQSMYGRFPASVHDLDQGEYFFDSKYLAETVPADGKIYLLLAGKDGTRFWLLQQGVDSGYVAGMEGTMQPLAPAELEKVVAENYRVIENIGNLVIVGTP